MTTTRKFITNTQAYGISAMFAFALLFAFGIAHADTLNRQLDVGMSGTDVSALQSFLAQDRTLYPQGLVTGYYGFLTKAAVSNFQRRNGIESVGRVGPITLAALNIQMAGGPTSNTGVLAPSIASVTVSANTNNATVGWNTNEAAQGIVYYSTSPLTTYENNNSVSVSGQSAMANANFSTSQSVSLPNLQANTTYYYLIYATDQAGNVSVTWPTTFKTAN